MAFGRFLRSALAGEEIVIYGDGRQVRDFTFVEDVVSANVLAASSSTVRPGTVYNISGGSNVSVNEVLDLIGDLLGRQLRVSYGPGMPGDVRRTGGSSGRAQEDLGWCASTSLLGGLAEQIEWLRAN